MYSSSSCSLEAVRYPVRLPCVQRSMSGSLTIATLRNQTRTGVGIPWASSRVTCNITTHKAHHETETCSYSHTGTVGGPICCSCHRRLRVWPACLRCGGLWHTHAEFVLSTDTVPRTPEDVLRSRTIREGSYRQVLYGRRGRPLPTDLHQFTFISRNGDELLLTGRDTYLLLSTGRRISANDGFLGINPQMEMSEGYDVYVPGDGVTLYSNHDVVPFTAEERTEIAAYLCGLWTAWASLPSRR